MGGFLPYWLFKGNIVFMIQIGCYKKKNKIEFEGKYNILAFFFNQRIRAQRPSAHSFPQILREN